MNNVQKQSRAILSRAQAWLDWLRAGGRSPRTLEVYGYAIERSVRFWRRRRGPALIQQVQLQDLEKWRAHLVKRGLSLVTVGYYLRPLVFFFQWLAARGEVLLNPAKEFVIPRACRRLHPVISEQDMARLLEGVPLGQLSDLRDRAIMETAYSTGMRLGELSGLDLTAVDLAEGIVVVTGKGQKQRTLPLTRKAIEALRLYIATSRPSLLGGHCEENALWISSKTRKRLRDEAIQRMVVLRSKAVGLALTPHSFRRAFATHMLRRGAGPVELQLLLGHTDLSHLRHYLRYAIVDLQKTHRKAKVSR
jgi:site-specific recombinase XerD